MRIYLQGTCWKLNCNDKAQARSPRFSRAQVLMLPLRQRTLARNNFAPYEAFLRASNFCLYLARSSASLLPLTGMPVSK